MFRIACCLCLAFSLPLAAEPPRWDAWGDPLPEGAVRRFGSLRFHAGSIAGAAKAPDGRTFTTISKESLLRNWDWATGRRLWELDLPDGIRADDFQLAYSGDGRLLAIACFKYLWLIDVSQRKPLWKVGRAKQGERDAIAVRIDDRHRLASVVTHFEVNHYRLGDGGFVRSQVAASGLLESVSPDLRYCFQRPPGRRGKAAWTLEEWPASKPIRTFPAQGPMKPVCAFSPDSSVAVYLRRTDDLAVLCELVETASGRVLKTTRLILAAKDSDEFDLKITPDNRSVVLSQTYARKKWLWSLDGNVVHELPEGDRRTSRGILLVDDRFADFADEHGVVHRWDLRTRTKLPAIHGYSGDKIRLLFSPDGRFLTVTEDETGRVDWIDLIGGSRQWLPSDANASRGDGSRHAFSMDSQLLHVGGAGGKLDIRDAARPGRNLGRLPEEFNGYRFKPLATQGQFLFSNHYRIVRFDTNAGKVTWERKLPVGDSGSQWSTGPSCDFSSNAIVMGRTSQTNQYFAAIDAFSGGDGSPILSLPATDREEQLLFRELHQSSDGRYLFFATGDGTVRVWLQGGKQLHCLEPTTCSLSKVACSADGKWFATQSADDLWRLFDTFTGREIFRKRLRGSGLNGLAFEPSGHRIAVAGEDADVLLYDLRPSGTPRGDFEAHWKTWQGGDAKSIFAATWNMVDHPVESIVFLKAKLIPAPAPDAAKVAAWIEELGDAAFAVREKASKSLAEVGRAVLPSLKAAIGKTADGERSRRLKVLVELKEGKYDPAEVALSRGIQVLELIDSEQSLALIRDLSKGPPGDLVAEEAKSALARKAVRGGPTATAPTKLAVKGLKEWK